MPNKTARYDLHTHLFTTWEKGRLSLERGSRHPDVILDSVNKAGVDGIALVNFADNRYEKFVYESIVHPGNWKISKNWLVLIPQRLIKSDSEQNMIIHGINHRDVL